QQQLVGEVAATFITEPELKRRAAALQDAEAGASAAEAANRLAFAKGELIARYRHDPLSISKEDRAWMIQESLVTVSKRGLFVSDEAVFLQGQIAPGLADSVPGEISRTGARLKSAKERLAAARFSIPRGFTGDVPAFMAAQDASIDALAGSWQSFQR